MSSEQGFDKVLQELGELREEVRSIKNFILGDELRGHDGLVQAVHDLRNDVYGDASRFRVGLIARTTTIQESLDRLERDWNKAKWAVAGWAGGAAAVATIAVNLLRLIMS